MSSEDKGSNLIFFMVGAAIGAGLGVLFAPKAGRETREQLGDWLKEKRHEGGELLSRVKEEGGELLSRVKEESLHKKDAIAAALKAGKQAYAEAEKHS
jgi:gas vesicle protein